MNYKLLTIKEDLFFAKLKRNIDKFIYLSFDKQCAWIGDGSNYYLSFNMPIDEPSEKAIWQWGKLALTRLATDEEQDEWYYGHESEPDYDPVTLAEMHEQSRYEQQSLNDPMRYPPR